MLATSPAPLAANGGARHWAVLNMNGIAGDRVAELGASGSSEGELKPVIYNYSNGVDAAMCNGGSGGDEDEYLEIVDQLSFKDEKHKDSLLSRLTTFRRNRELCDTVLLVDKHELYAHKAVLAAVSPTLLELLTLSGREESPAGTTGRTTVNGASKQAQDSRGQQREITPPESQSSPAFLEFNDIDYDCFEALINYAYSGSLEICRKKAADLYKTACRLRMSPCARACAKYLTQQLSPQNCIGVRRCANGTNDSLLASKVDGYIQENFAEIFENSKEFLTLPSVQVEVLLHVTGDRPDCTMPLKEEQLAGKVLDWLQLQAHDLPEHAVFRMDMLTEKAHMLYMTDDNTLQDCCDLDDTTAAGSSDLIQDYKKSSRRCSGPVMKSRSNAPMLANTSGKQIGRVSSTESMNSAGSEMEEVEWKIVAVHRLSETYCTALAVMNRQLTALSIRVIDGGPIPVENNTSQSNQRRQSSDRIDDIPFATMAVPRCAVGADCLRGKLVVCGGYDRGECLGTVEQYDPSSNTWTMLPSMNKERGRFGATVENDKMYAVGGSDGARDLNTAECYYPESRVWTKTAPMVNARSNHGVSSSNGYVYAIGGCQWQRPLKHCERYDCVNDAWTAVAPLQHARYQAGCCAVANEVVAVGGFDTWTCTNSAECYNPEENTWRPLPSLGTARRGCGVAVLGNSLYVLGGSDGLQALCSVEVLDLDDPQAGWKLGPPLNTPRDNVRAVVVRAEQGDRLFAVGGFNGKSFLNTIECLDENTQEWTANVHKPAIH